jgi:hypothetical protein
MNEFKCDRYIEHPEGGAPLLATNSLVSGSKKEAEEYGKNSIGQEERSMSGITGNVVDYKIWQRIS